MILRLWTVFVVTLALSCTCAVADTCGPCGHQYVRPGRVLNQALYSSGLRLSHRERKAWRQAQWSPWHGRYFHTEWGSPVALVVPPTATFQTNWGWGVGNTRISRINHQFARPYPGPYGGSEGFRPTPRWPSDTTQFGVYSVRGPW